MRYARTWDDGKQKYMGLQSFDLGNGRLGYREGDERVGNIMRMEDIRKLIQIMAVPTLFCGHENWTLIRYH
jgi:hypothetical protein